MKKIIVKKLCSVMMTAVIITASIPVRAATQDETSLSDDVVTVTQLMEELLTESYQKDISEIEDYVRENEYDYNLSMNTMYEKGNPYADMNYQEILAALCIAVGNNADENICSANFLVTEKKECTIAEYDPVKIDTYIETEDGLYEKSGFRYVTEPGYYDNYVQTDKGIVLDGQKYIGLKSHDIQYIDITLHAVTAEELLEQYGIKMCDVEDEYNYRLHMIKTGGITEQGLESSIFIKAATDGYFIDDGAKNQLNEVLEQTTGNRLALIETAANLIGQVPYLWGGKPQKAGYDTSWWTFNEDGKQNGLDCSGFVEYCFWTAGYPESTYQNLISTMAINSYAQTISQSELQPGDLGLLHDGTEDGTNHVGIYLGNGYWIHCSSSADTVTVNQFNFNVFKRVPGVDDTILVPLETVDENTGMEYTADDVTLMAKMVWHEAAGEGMNAWIAVAEVAKNRVLSDRYPNTLSEVIYQENEAGMKQFSYNEDIQFMEPPESVYSIVESVMQGKLSVLRNQNILYFRNPGSMEDNSDWGTFPFYMRINNTVFYSQGGN